MRILMLVKYPPIQGGVSADAYWTAQLFAEMGHEVHVVTNAEEVEGKYRMRMTEEDEKLLTGYRIPNSITVHKSYVDPKHIYIPQGNPSVSKLTSIALRVCEKVKPDFIWASYVEPYGVAALLVSALTSIPYTIRHAGSDIGRLMMTEQLKPLYERVFREATAVLTGPTHYDRFLHMGVDAKRIVPGITARAPSDLFQEKAMPEGQFVLGCYGKVGPSKGTPELLEAMTLLEERKHEAVLKTHWGGRGIERYEETIKKLDNVMLDHFIPHWQVPKFIWSCSAILFLENNFSISFHTPGVPLESLACGRPIITTEEIARKNERIIERDVNSIVIPSNPLTAKAIAEAIERMTRMVKAGWPNAPNWPKPRCDQKEAMGKLIERIQATF